MAEIYHHDNETVKIILQRGVRQSCKLSPTLFDGYSEIIFHEPYGVRIVDTVIIAESIKYLHFLLYRVTKECANNGLAINTSAANLVLVGETLAL